MTRPNIPVPQLPSLDELDLSVLRLEYDDDTDTLMVHFNGQPEAAVSVYLNAYMAARVHLETNDVVGVYIEDFLSRLVFEDPRALEMADLIADIAGIDRQRLAAIRGRLGRDARMRAALDTMFGSLTSASA
jgi:hypothetical protein